MRGPERICERDEISESASFPATARPVAVSHFAAGRAIKPGVTLEEQDRSRWDRNEIEEGTSLVEASLRRRRVGPYQLQAAIAAVHANAKSSDATDWAEIEALYRELMAVSPSPVIALNHAVAVVMSEGLEQGLALLERLSSDLEGYYLFHAAKADLLRRLGRNGEAGAAYRAAIELATNEVEQAYLKRRLEQVAGEEAVRK